MPSSPNTCHLIFKSNLRWSSEAWNRELLKACKRPCMLSWAWTGENTIIIVVYSTKCNNECRNNRVLSIEKLCLSLSKRHVYNCTSCPYIEHGRNQYTFHSTGETHHIKSHITCETLNVIYLIQCRLCNLQNCGETNRRLKDRFNEHRRTILNPTGNYIHTQCSLRTLSNQ